MRRLIINIIVCLAFVNVSMPGHAIDRNTLIQYASTLKGKKKAELKTAISNLCKPIKVLSYGSGAGSTWSGFVKTDRIGNTLECRNRYSEDRFYFSSYTQTSVISGMNIEHSFPQSWWGGTSNNLKKDLFNVYPSASDANSKKSNYPMGKVTDPSILDDYEKVGKGPAGSLGNIQLCEPNDLWKGDFCRSYFYMATIYQNTTWDSGCTQALQQLENDTWPTLREWAYTLYLEWTRTDTVSTIEVDRNNAIYNIQGNRNLFIDFPYLAEYVWGDSIDVAFDPYTSFTTADDDSRYRDSTITPDPPVPPVPPVVDPEGEYYWAETFAGSTGTGGNDGGWSGGVASTTFTSACADSTGWITSNAYVADGCIRLGTGSKQGYAITPYITGLEGCSFYLCFKAGAWSGDNTTLKLVATNCTLSEESVTLVNGSFTEYLVHVTDVTGPVTIKFVGAQTSKNRFFLDEINIPKESIISSAIDYIAFNYIYE